MKERNIRVRDLPFPYRNFLSVSSDCDSQSPETSRKIETVSRTELQLPLSDSFFPSTDGIGFSPFENRYGQAECRIEATPTLPYIKEQVANGWLDVIHGVAENFRCVKWAPIIIRDFARRGDACGSYAFEQSSGFSGMRVEFISFDLMLSETVNDFELSFTDVSGATHWIAESGNLSGRPGWELPQCSKDAKWRRIFLECSQERNICGRCAFHDAIEVKASCAKTSKGRVVIANYLYANMGRNEISRILNDLDHNNINILACTSHGQPFEVGTIGNERRHRILGYKNLRIYKILFELLRRASANWRAGGDWSSFSMLSNVLRLNEHGDNPESPFYHTDLLRSYGIKYLRFNHHTHAPDYSTINNLVKPEAAYDGTLFYKFVSTTFPLAEPHTNATFHKGLREFLSKIPLWRGGILYTHWGCFTDVEETPRKVFSAEALIELRRVKELFDEGALWVAPTSRLLEYASLIRKLPKNIKLDGDDIHISSWLDEITGEKTPNTPKDVAGVTFLFKERGERRVFLDDVRIDSVNGFDHGMGMHYTQVQDC
ncbi:MAG: hypothetical protein GXP32_08580 [Kiritimatiellaeota bacterium]|nr:hypothetical protein [Kiritimatiellota bacterium]